MRKIHCEEVIKEGFDKVPFKELCEMIGWVEPIGKGENKWTVTLEDGCIFECNSQEIAQLMASIEEVKALMLRK